MNTDVDDTGNGKRVKNHVVAVFQDEEMGKIMDPYSNPFKLFRRGLLDHHFADVLISNFSVLPEQFHEIGIHFRMLFLDGFELLIDCFQFFN